MEVLSPADQDERKRLQTLVQTLSGKLSSLEEAADRDYETEERKWRVADVVEAVSKGGATLTAQKDGVVAVSGKAPQEDTYSVTLKLTEGTHTALRLETLPEKLSSGELAVGRNGANPNFVLSELTVESLDATGWRP
jgi:DhnA family fructose-bisphosphate aldolase class Ia